MSALHLPVAAVEWACHAPTTIKDASGKVLAECSGYGRHAAEDEAIAAEIVRRVNAYDRLQADVMTLALRLHFEDDNMNAPETRDVLARWRPLVNAEIARRTA